MLRIYPVYLFAVVFWVIVVRYGMAPKPTGPVDIATHLLFVHTFFPSTFFSISGVLWSLAVEVHFYLLFPFLVLLKRSTRLMLALGSLLISIVLTFSLSAEPTPENFVLTWNVVTFAPLFLLGMELHGFRPTSMHRWLAFGAGCLSLVAMLAPPFLGLTPMPNSGLDLLGRIVIGGGIATACLVASPQWPGNGLFVRAITAIGIASYSIYLYNYIFVALPQPSVTGLVGLVVYSAMVIVFGMLMWALVERPFEALRHRGFRRFAIVEAARPRA